MSPALLRSARIASAFAIAALAGPSAIAADPDQPAAIHSVICAAAPPGDETHPAAEILPGYGSGGFQVAATPQAQAYFSNGMQLAHAFAHKAAVSAFQEASKLDPTCAMCVWGEAWARGPTINYPIDAAEQAKLAALADKAAGLLRPDAPRRDRMLIAALRQRYHAGGGKGPGDFAFARGVDAAARSLPNDSEVAVIAADAWMIPAAHRNSRDNLPRALDLLKAALDRDPGDTGAIHFYIHATEMDGVAGEALPYAKRLGALAPKASHLNHMPSHTYYLVGLYRDAVKANLDAIELDEANAKRLTLRDGVWGLNYHGHNLHFGLAAAMVDGDAKAAVGLSQDVVARASTLGPKSSYGGRLLTMAYAAQGRYGDPQRVLALPTPGGERASALAPIWRYARGEALARQGKAAEVSGEADAIELGKTPSPTTRVAKLVLQGRAAMLQGRPLVAADAYRRAAEVQEAKFPRTDDPATWWYPVRRSLAAALLEAGRPQQALAETAKVLRLWPDDPLTLLVQARAEERLGQAPAAAAHLSQARQGWTGDPTTMAAALL